MPAVAVAVGSAATTPSNAPAVSRSISTKPQSTSAVMTPPSIASSIDVANSVSL